MNYFRYIGVFLGTQLALGVAVWALNSLLGIDISSSGMAVIPPLIAAMDLGDVHARTTGRLPEPGAAWRFAVIATLISFCLSVGFTVLAGLVLPDEVAELRKVFALSAGSLTGVMAGFAAFMFGFVLVVILLVSRYFFTFGAKAKLKSLKIAGR